jgi:hypothetical protein
MPSSPTPGSSYIHKFQSRDVDIGLHRVLTGSALPTLPQIRFVRVVDFVASVVRTLLRPASLLAPLHGSDRIAPAIGDVYFQASNGSVPLPVAGYNYSIDWTPMLAGLSPAGMAASLAAPTRAAKGTCSRYPAPVRIRFRYVEVIDLSDHFCHRERRVHFTRPTVRGQNRDSPSTDARQLYPEQPKPHAPASR